MQENNIIQTYTTRWQQLRGLEAVLYGLGAGIFVGFISTWIIAGIAFLVVTAIALVIIQPWKIGVEKTSSYIDKQLATAEYSSSLLLASPLGLSGLAQLQQQKVSELLSTQIKTIPPKTGLKQALLIALGLLVAGFLISRFLLNSDNNDFKKERTEQVVTFAATDSVAANYAPPSLVKQRLTITYPTYTRLGSRTTSDMNIKVVEGTRLFWKLEFDGAVRNVELEGFDGNIGMTGDGNAFAKAYKPTASGYYNFRFQDTTGASYASEMYAIELTEDKIPEVAIKDIPKFTSFEFTDKKELVFTTQISDDYGIESAHIIATVSKGSGESVKFREEKLAFDQSFTKGSKSVKLNKKLNLDALKMEVGDELYFYVETADQKTPRPNIARSETFFAVIKDTVSDSFGVEGTMGADLMPDYFRSQRQLIIDTEKLIKEKPQLLLEEFKRRSNDLGFDQKSLRLKYGQFMGDEDDSGIATNVSVPDSDDYDADDPTAGFRHDHDTENEHTIVEHDHEEEGDDDDEERSPFEEYMHNHDDPEESTLFTESLKSKLKNAMAQMWDAELYLRLHKPSESLPYQYKALKLIQEIKNSARIYVHRIGFDPPPIKEDKRLTGDLEEVDNFYKNEDLEKEDAFIAIRESVSILEETIVENRKLSVADKSAFAKAGQELAAIAIKEPARHLTTLQQLKWLTEDKKQSVAVLRSVQKGLLAVLPEVSAQPSSKEQYKGALERIFMQELNASDR